MVLDQVIKRFVSRDTSTWVALAATAIFLVLCYAGVRILQRRGLYLRI